MKATDLLIDEHKVILRALDVLDAISAGVDLQWKRADIGKILDFLRWYADGHHQAKEDTILFPALKAAAASQNRPVDHMMHEHAQERSMVEQLEKDLRLADAADFVACANRLSSTLRNHIYKEDRILFETAGEILTPEQDEKVFSSLTRFETEWDKQILSDKLRELRSLEWSYLQK